jgi:hypothetical protein
MFTKEHQTDFRLTRWLFLRFLGVIYAIAFVSFGVQARGLIGSDGISPMRDVFPFVEQNFSGLRPYLRFPTLMWISHSDAFLTALWITGALCALLLIFRVAPALMLFACWLIYLSLVTAGQVFMSFQWDILLLEVGFLAIFLAPFNLRPSAISQNVPSPIVMWLFRWLVFRLMFASGLVKLNSHDPVWRDLSALAYHFETQPLPTPLAWYVHQLPGWMLEAATASMFFIELAVPFLFLLPDRLRKLRIAGALLTMAFQMLILLTGNYTFFNWLTIALCILLLDDTFLRRIFPRGIKSRLSETVPSIRLAHTAAMTVLLLVIAWLSIPLFYAQVFGTPLRPGYLEIYREVAPLRLTNTYGLFAVMTTSRPEVIIEGSADGETWVEYGLRHQPQKLDEWPTIVAPHQPRLDWQLWFAALGNYQRNPWFVNLIHRLLQGSDDVEALFAKNPFPDEPPMFVRAQIYDYTFTDWSTRSETGQWWQRELRGEYLSAVSLESFRQQ